MVQVAEVERVGTGEETRGLQDAVGSDIGNIGKITE